MARVTNRAVFNDALLPQGRSRLGSFGAGFGLELLALAAILVIPLLLPQKMDSIQRYWTTPIAALPIVAWKPQPPPKPEVVKKPVVLKEAPKPEVVELPKPRIYNPVVSAPVAKPKIRTVNPAPEMPEVAKVFPDESPLSLGSSAIPTLKRPREAVQTGGFGDPDGLHANNETKRSPNAAQLGGYDMPTGPGKGNGTGGSKGAAGVVASAGFGNDVAAGNSSRNHGVVQSAGFADEHAVAAPRVRPASDISPRTLPVEILFKPKPSYTSEATAKRIEGDVVLQVTFTSSGQVVVQRIVQGLGYGLDESAEAAARQIRFRPAQQDGQPVDSTVNVRITFELAY
ncbi:MAG TPA: TonB family protein [Candidatus Acidoferrum sp.]|nr:TonB family protein [Candidatus Acidoferrum sp.]